MSNKTNAVYHNYDNSILNHYGISPYHSTLPLLDNILKIDYENVVVLLFDGMGSDCLSKNLSSNGFLNRKKLLISQVYIHQQLPRQQLQQYQARALWSMAGLVGVYILVRFRNLSIYL